MRLPNATARAKLESAEINAISSQSAEIGPNRGLAGTDLPRLMPGTAAEAGKAWPGAIRTGSANQRPEGSAPAADAATERPRGHQGVANRLQFPGKPPSGEENF